MAKLTEEMKDLIEKQRLSFVATTDLKGRTNVPPQGLHLSGR